MFGYPQYPQQYPQYPQYPQPDYLDQLNRLKQQQAPPQQMQQQTNPDERIWVQGQGVLCIFYVQICRHRYKYQQPYILALHNIFQAHLSANQRTIHCSSALACLLARIKRLFSFISLPAFVPPGRVLLSTYN